MAPDLEDRVPREILEALIQGNYSGSTTMMLPANQE